VAPENSDTGKSAVKEEWTQISGIAVGLDEERLPSSEVLAGQQFALSAAGVPSLSLDFSDAKSLCWRHSGDSTDETYDAVEVAPALFIVGICHRRDPRLSTTLALDLETRRATRVLGRLPSVAEADTSLLSRVHANEGLSPVGVEFDHWEIELPGHSKPASSSAHTRTRDLLGKRLVYTYGDGGVYEHIYLNESRFTWHCLKGPEAGLADTEHCNFYRIRPDVYLFSWREKIIPTLGVVLVNTKEMRSSGFITGIDTRSGEVSHFPVGAQGSLVNATEPPR
jgi:hypothetical protein|tara:strand:- start:1343 stop:2185 length:843 start_codon:yes stop_codon:yes gene_type:complete